MPWFLILLAVVAVEVVAYLIMPKPKAPKPAAVQDEQAPTAEAGRPIPVTFGEITVSGVNVLWYGDKATRTYQVNA